MMVEQNAMSTIEIMTMGMECLVEKMGIIAAETFVAAIQRERFDYTKWHQEQFANDVSCEDFLSAAADFEKTQKIPNAAIASNQAQNA